MSLPMTTPAPYGSAGAADGDQKRSAVDGQTWSIVYTTSAYRHGHAVQVNPYTGDVYVLWGDKEDVAAIERSTDHGQTWHKVCTTVLCVGVDIAFSPQGFAVFGRDSPFGPGAIQRLDLASGVSTTVASMAGTSFSAEAEAAIRKAISSLRRS